MSKKRGHLWSRRDLAVSVLTGKEIEALCGVAAVMTRERINTEVRRDVCGECVRKAAASPPAEGVVEFHDRSDWLPLLELAFKELYEDFSSRPARTYGTPATFTYKYTSVWPSKEKS